MKRHRILLIEDYPVHQELERDALEEAGFQVTPASSLIQAEDALVRVLESPEEWLIILDLRIAGEVHAGLRVLEALEKNPTYQQVPVLIASALNPDEVAEEMKTRNLRPREYLAKPFLRKTLVERVGSLVG